MQRLPSNPRRGWAWLALGAFLLATLFAAACGDDDSTATPTKAATTAASTAAATQPATPTATPVPLDGKITVFAAASLTDAFKEAGAVFTAANPKASVAFSFAGSSALATQINQGAPADVFASADGTNMRLVSDKGSTEPQVILATNVPVVVVPASGSPVASFEDLAKSGVKLVLAAPAVPIGNYARMIFTNASAAAPAGISADFSTKVLANLKSNEADVKSVLAKIQTGEGDAGVVYKTDAAVAGNQVKTVDIPEKYNVIAEYPIAVLKSSGNLAVARAFVAFVTAGPGQAILTKYGFGKPAATSATSSSIAISGLVDHPGALTADQVKSGTQLSTKATDKDGTEKTYSGLALATVLKNAGVQAAATQIIFTGSDGYAQTLQLSALTADPNAIIVVDPDGTLRNIIPTQPPRTWVKLLVKIEIK